MNERTNLWIVIPLWSTRTLEKEFLECLRIGKYTTCSRYWTHSGGFHQLWWIDSRPIIKKWEGHIEFKAELDNLLGKHIKALQLDQGGVSSRFNSFHMEHGIIYQLCALGTLLNGLMEKRYRTLINIVILMIGFSLLPILFGDTS